LEQIQYHIKCRKGDVHRAVLLPGDPARATYIAENFFANPRQVSENREFRIFNGLYEGFPLAVCSTGIGCMSSAVAIEELVNVGCKYFLRVGTAGSLQAGIRPGEIVIATGAVRGDGASREYIHPSYPAVADFSLLKALRKRAEREKVPYHLGIIRSHDAFYRESPLAFGDFKKRVRIWVEAGVLAIENESSTLFVVGSLRKAQVGSILVIAGSLATGEEASYEEIRESVDMAIKIAAGALVDLLKGENEP
jgi:uridine phosphorylase